MRDAPRNDRFDGVVLAHLDAAHNLARWMTGDAAAAEDVVQEAALRALRFLDDDAGEYPRAWFMAIVRNGCIDWLRDRRRRGHNETPYDEDLHTEEKEAPGAFVGNAPENPEAQAIRAADARWVRACIEQLPANFREVIVLREPEEMSYKEISAIVAVPIGTVMSRLARGRDLLLQAMAPTRKRAEG